MKKSFKRKIQIRYNALVRKRQREFYGGMEKLLDDFLNRGVDLEKANSRYHHVLETNPEMDEDRLSNPPEVQDYIFNAAQKDIDSLWMYGAKFFAASLLTTAAAYSAWKLGHKDPDYFYKTLDYGLASISCTAALVSTTLAAASVGLAVLANSSREPRLTEEERRVSNYIWNSDVSVVEK